MFFKILFMGKDFIVDLIMEFDFYFSFKRFGVFKKYILFYFFLWELVRKILIFWKVEVYF